MTTRGTSAALLTDDVPLMLGTVQLGVPYGVANRTGMPSEADAFAVLDAAWASGIRSFDTASAYGIAEERLGRWLKARGHVAEVATKLAALPATELDPALALRKSVERSLSLLGVDAIDHYLLHATDDWRRHAQTLLPEVEALQAAGKLRRFGISTYSADDAALASTIDVVASVQVPMNMLDVRLVRGGQLHALRARGVTVFARSAFLQGLFALDVDALPERVAHAHDALVALHDFCRAHGTTALEQAIGFVARRGVDRVVVGAETPQQVTDTVERLAKHRLPELDALWLAACPPVDENVINPSRWQAQSMPAGISVPGARAAQ